MDEFALRMNEDPEHNVFAVSRDDREDFCAGVTAFGARHYDWIVLSDDNHGAGLTERLYDLVKRCKKYKKNKVSLPFVLFFNLSSDVNEFEFQLFLDRIYGPRHILEKKGNLLHMLANTKDVRVLLSIPNSLKHAFLTHRNMTQ
jgi:hypothetical protein